MTDEEIEAEVQRVGKLVREYLVDACVYADECEYSDLRVQTWGVCAVLLARDEEGETHEVSSAGWETSSRALQTGILHRLLHGDYEE